MDICSTPLILSAECGGSDMEFQIQSSPTRTNHLGHSDVPGYATGEWTPSVGGTATYDDQRGKFTKTGRLISISFNLTINSIGTGSTTVISGLPFVVSDLPGTAALFWFGAANNFVYCIGEFVANSNTIVIRNATAATATLGSSDFFMNGTNVRGSGIYFTTTA